MGRVKLMIKPLETMSRRQLTYSKRKAGIMKKATELSILCDIDILLLIFSPTGKGTLCLGEHSKFEDVINKFAQLTPQERAKRKLESLEALKKTFKKLDHEVNIPNFLGSSNQTIEELSTQLQNSKSQLSDMQRRLSYWTEPDNVDSIEQITQMENALMSSLNQIQIRKSYLVNQPLQLDYSGKIPTFPHSDYSGEFNNVMHMPVDPSNRQQPSNMQWHHDGVDQNFMLPGVPSLLPQRNNLCFAELSPQDYNGYFNTEKQVVHTNNGQHEPLNDLCQHSCLQHQLGAQYPYNSNDMNPFAENVQPNREASLQENQTDFQVNNGLNPPMKGFDNTIYSWVDTSVTFDISKLNSVYTKTKQMQ